MPVILAHRCAGCESPSGTGPGQAVFPSAPVLAEGVAGMTGPERTETWTTAAQGSGPPGPRPWRSAPAAVLLNLTGLGLGYLYLGRRWRRPRSAAVTAVLVVVAFATDAAKLLRCCGRRRPSWCS